MRQEIRVIDHKGKKIVLFDFSHCKKEDIKPIIYDAKQWFLSKRPNSILTLTDVTEARYDTETLSFFKEFTLHNKPYVRAGAVVGITNPLLKFAYRAVTAFSKRNLPIFNTHEEALDWLMDQ